jgi:membrane protease YdiL (CAAX protease family)
MTFSAAPQRRTGRWWNILHFPPTRIVVAFLALLVSVGAIQSLLVQPLRAAPTLSSPGSLAWLAAYLAGSVAIALGCYRAYVRLVERRRADELSRGGAVGGLAYGGLLGAALFAITLGTLWLLGVAQITATGDLTVIGVALAADIAGAVVEELLLRGILFRIVEESTGTWLALAISALVFSGLHIGNPDVPLALAAIVGIAGALLPGAAYILTRRLWLSIGIHAGWDVLQSIIFGMAFAGHQAPGLAHVQLTGSLLLTGGGLGVEGSIVALAASLALSSYLLARAVRQGRVVQPFWRRTHPAQV